VNDTADEVRHIVTFIRDLMALRAGNGRWDKSHITYELLAFHKLGSDKYRSLGMEYRAMPLDPPTRQQMNELLGIATDAGIEARIR
jgi:pyruvate-formate lyase-activating enzyme